MLTALRNDERLVPFLKDKCEESGGYRDTLIEIDQSVKNHITVVKVEEYYIQNAKRGIKQIDCLTVSSLNDETNLYLIEIKEPKNIARFKNIKSKEIRQKFTDTIGDFMTERFGGIFLNEDHKISDFKTYFVSSLFENKRLKEIEYESSLLNKPLSFRGFVSVIEKKHPSDFVNIIV